MTYSEQHPTEHYEHSWRGIRLRIAYSPYAKGSGNDQIYSFIEVETSPTGHPLPIAETGYRWQHIPRTVIEQDGGPIAYVEDWLNVNAQSKTWMAIEREMRQGRLF